MQSLYQAEILLKRVDPTFLIEYLVVGIIYVVDRLQNTYLL